MPARTFDADGIARYEMAGWRAYYDREWARLLQMTVGMCQAQFGIPFPLSLKAAYHIVRASVAWAPIDHDEVAPGLVVSARSDDGTIQAVELADHPFGVAVQWHPEEDAAEDARLFAGLGDAAKEYRSVVERVETEGAHHG